MNLFSLENKSSKEKMDYAEHLLAAARKAFDTGSIDEGLMFQQEAFMIKAGVLGREHHETAAVAEELGDTAHRLNHVETVIAFLQKQLAGLTRSDPRLLYLGSLTERVGNACNRIDRLEEAGELYHLALRAYEKAGMAEDRQALFLLQKMVGVQYNLGDLTSAQLLAERVVALDEHLFGAEHPKTAADLSSLGNILNALGKHEDARAAYERAVAIEDQLLNWDNPRLSSNLATLAELLIKIGDLNAARVCMERTLLIDEKSFGTTHPKIAVDLTNLADLLQKLGDLQGALLHLERLVTIDRAVFGEDSPRLADDLSRLAALHREINQPEKARDAFVQALEINEKALGPHHLKLAPLLETLSSIQHVLGDGAAAVKNLERALQIYETYLPSDYPAILAARERMRQLSTTQSTTRPAVPGE